MPGVGQEGEEEGPLPGLGELTALLTDEPGAPRSDIGKTQEVSQETRGCGLAPPEA